MAKPTSNKVDTIEELGKHGRKAINVVLENKDNFMKAFDKYSHKIVMFLAAMELDGVYLKQKVTAELINVDQSYISKLRKAILTCVDSGDAKMTTVAELAKKIGVTNFRSKYVVPTNAPRSDRKSKEEKEQEETDSGEGTSQEETDSGEGTSTPAAGQTVQSFLLAASDFSRQLSAGTLVPDDDTAIELAVILMEIVDNISPQADGAAEQATA